MLGLAVGSSGIGGLVVGGCGGSEGKDDSQFALKGENPPRPRAPGEGIGPMHGETPFWTPRPEKGIQMKRASRVLMVAAVALALGAPVAGRADGIIRARCIKDG